MKNTLSVLLGTFAMVLVSTLDASAAVIFSGGGGPFPARKLAVREEIPVSALFAPYQGFDDNDQVQVVVHGTLPNACFSLADSFSELQGDLRTILVQQFAVRRIDGICAEGATLPVHLQMTVPFTREISIGRLKAGKYNLQYLSEKTSQRELRPMLIERAPVATIDSMPYAVISNATVSDVVLSSQETEVVLSGVLNSSCVELNPEVTIERDRDVIVLLPTVKYTDDVVCSQMLVPFRLKVSLGKLQDGDYLLHVRSMNGESVSRVIHSVATYR